MILMGVKKIALYMSPFFVFSIIMWILTGNRMLAGQKPVAKGDNEYAIILGAKVSGITPTLSLRYRLDSALEYARKYSHVKLILSGGQGPDETITEAEAMKEYLIENGINEERLLLEDASTSTYENIAYSIKLIPESVEGVTIITSDYHLARAREIVRKFDLKTDAVTAKTPKVVKRKMENRERLALLKILIIRK